MFKLFRKKKTLRDVCGEKYGDDFLDLYDELGSGVPIGTIEETKIVLRMIEKAREEIRNA